MSDDKCDCRRPRANWRHLIISALIGMFTLFVSVGILASACEPDDEEVAASEPKPATTAIPSPNPTATPWSWPPTATPGVTPRPVTECPTAEEQSYFDDIADWTADIDNTVLNISVFLTDATSDPSLIYDDAWNRDVLAQTRSLGTQADYMSLDEFPRPGTVENIHRAMVVYAGSVSHASFSLSWGISSMDNDMVIAGFESLQEGLPFLEQAFEETDNFCS